MGYLACLYRHVSYPIGLQHAQPSTPNAEGNPRNQPEISVRRSTAKTADHYTNRRSVRPPSKGRNRLAIASGIPSAALSARRDDVHRHCPLRAGGVYPISAVLHLHRSRLDQGGGAAGVGRGRRRVNRRWCAGRRARYGRRGSHAESRRRGGGECLKPGTWWPPPKPSSNMPRRGSTPPRRSTPSCRHSRMRSQSMRSRKPKCLKQLLLFPTEMPEPPHAEALLELTAIEQGIANDPSVLLVREHDSC